MEFVKENVNTSVSNVVAMFIRKQVMTATRMNICISLETERTKGRRTLDVDEHPR
jgi:hypothetical protein